MEDVWHGRCYKESIFLLFAHEKHNEPPYGGFLVFWGAEASQCLFGGALLLLIWHYARMSSFRKLALHSVLLCSLMLMALLIMFGSSAWGLELSLPLRCDYGSDCFIQNYVDTDASSGRSDYYCGKLTYDTHKGTDFRVPWANYLKGVEVLAAAPGVVIRIRDEMEDRDARGREEDVGGKEAGNAVILQHDDGYETMYAHLKKGSVRVRPGDKVERGDVLGLVGMSGLTVFSHLHFGVMHKGVVIDPFKGSNAMVQAVCGETERSLWSRRDLASMKYVATGLVQAGFFPAKPALPDVVRVKSKTVFSDDAPMLIFAATAYGVQPGDKLRVRIIAPGGQRFAQGEKDCTNHQAQRLIFTGRKLGKGRQWTKGEYRGEYEIVRMGRVILRTDRIMRVK